MGEGGNTPQIIEQLVQLCLHIARRSRSETVEISVNAALAIATST